VAEQLLTMNSKNDFLGKGKWWGRWGMVSNFNTGRFVGLGQTATAMPEDPRSKEWIQHAVDQCDQQLNEK